MVTGTDSRFLDHAGVISAVITEYSSLNFKGVLNKSPTK